MIAHLPEHNALITRFVQGRQLTAEDVRRPEILRRLGEALRRCHAYPAPPDLGAFSPFEVIRHYRDLAGARGVPLPHDLGRALDLLARIEEIAAEEQVCLAATILR